MTICFFIQNHKAVANVPKVTPDPLPTKTVTMLHIYQHHQTILKVLSQDASPEVLQRDLCIRCCHGNLLLL